ncbi:MAG: MC/SLC25 family protein [Flammeovirgaceae bacterium]
MLKQLLREGNHAFYAGYFTNLARITPHYAITFVLYEYFSRYFHEMLD